ncbi:MAG: ABC transporter permease [Bacteroidales bacterium]|nr:ABC transporter permease [Bacteroidales bacterium]
MFRTNLKLIFRNIWKYKGFSSINIIGLSVGMACSIIILLWVKHHTSYDKFHEKADNIFRVIQHIKFEDYTTWAITQGPLGPDLKEEVPEIEDYCRLNQSGLRFIKGEESFRERGTYADPSFFNMFTINVTKKLKNSPVSEPNNIAISESFAQKYFGDEDPIGKTISALPDREFLITAVFEDYPQESHIWFDYVIPFEHLGNLGYTIDQWDNSGYNTYVSLQEGVTKEQVVTKIEDFLGPKPTLEEFAKLDLQPIKEIHLTAGIDMERADIIDGKYVKIFLIIGIFLIVVACINFMNLATARSSRRMREIGMKKVSGAHKPNLIFQFIGEAILISFIAVFIAMMLVELFRPTFNNITQMGLKIDYTDFRIYLALFGIVLTTGLFAGSYPAFYLASFKPVAVLKGGSGESKKYNFRKILVIFQFTISIILITSTFFVSRQINFMLNKDLGYDKEGIIYFGMSEGFQEHFESIKDEMLKSPGVLNMTRAGSMPTYGYNFSNSRFRWEGQDLSKETLFRATFADYDYFSTYNIEFADGREFSKDFASDSSAIILNEAAAKAIGFDNPIGKQLWFVENPRKMTVVGVNKDFHYRSLHTDIEPQIIMFQPSQCYWSILKINIKELSSISKKLEEHWIAYESQSPLNINFLDEDLANLYEQDKVIRKIILFFTTIGILISILGLIGMTGYSIEQKTKEIGIRKALGANFKTIIVLLSKDFTKWILISFVIATPITYYIMNKWLDSFAYRINLDWWMFVLGGLSALIIALITINIQTSKAARINPAESLRYE